MAHLDDILPPALGILGNHSASAAENSLGDKRGEQSGGR